MNQRPLPSEMEVASEVIGPEIKIRPVYEVEGFDLEGLSEASPNQIPDGIPYAYGGRAPQFLARESEHGSSWVSHLRHDSTALSEPLPEGIDLGVTYVNWQGRRYQRKEGYGEQSAWEEVDIPNL